MNKLWQSFINLQMLVASIIEQQQQIDQLKTEIEELKNKKGVIAIR